MPAWAILAFVVVDILVIVIVLRAVLEKHGGLSKVLGVDLAQIIELSKEMERETEEYLRANWSGDPATLSPALASLLDRFEARCRERNVAVSREQLKTMLARLVPGRRLAKRGDVNEALRQVA